MPDHPPSLTSALRRSLLLLPLAALAPPKSARAGAPQPLLLFAGAGYKRPTEALCGAFTHETGIPVERSYGNLQQIFAQARASGRVDVLIGDSGFIDAARDLELPQRLPLGEGVLMLAWRHNLPGRLRGGIADPVRDLPRLRSIALPNPQQAIYGRAAQQWLEAKALWSALQDRLQIVQTVPQVSAYVTTGQVDAGFLNRTEVLAVRPRLGGAIALRPGAGSYAPITIVAALPPAAQHPGTLRERERFAGFLRTPLARRILREAGL